MIAKTNKDNYLFLLIIVFLCISPTLLWFLDIRCNSFIQIFAITINLVTLLNSFHKGNYVTAAWLAVTWFNCFSIIMHDMFGVSFLTSGYLFSEGSGIFENVRWATVVASIFSSAIAAILPHSFNSGALKNLAFRYRTCLSLKSSIIFICIAGIFLYLSQINSPFLFSFGYAGAWLNIVPRELATVFGLIGYCTFLVSLIPLFEYRILFKIWPRKYLYTFLIILMIILIVMILKGERATVIFILTVFLLFLHASHRRERTNVKTLIGFIVVIWLLIYGLGNVRSTAGGVLSLRHWISSMRYPLTVSMGNLVIPSSSMYHMVRCVEFWNNGFRRWGESYWMLLFQQFPTVIANILRIERPISDPEYLSQLLPDQPGGIYVLAQAYWNFGMIGIIAFILIILPLLWTIEHKLMNSNTAGMIFGFAIAAIMPKFMFYGIQWGIRIMSIFLLLVLILKRYAYFKLNQRNYYVLTS